MKYCAKCGEALSDESRFCKSCGAPFESVVEEPKEEESNGSKIALIIILSITGFLFTLVLGFTLVFFLGIPRESRPQYDGNLNDYSYSQEDSMVTNQQASKKEQNDDYMIADSDSRYISKSELYSFTEWELKIARNEIYARHGRKFGDSALQSYFDSKDWYNGYVDAKNFKESVFNSYEKENIKIIVEYEKDRGYR